MVKTSARSFFGVEVSIRLSGFFHFVSFSFLLPRSVCLHRTTPPEAGGLRRKKKSSRGQKCRMHCVKDAYTAYWNRESCKNTYRSIVTLVSFSFSFFPFLEDFVPIPMILPVLRIFDVSNAGLVLQQTDPPKTNDREEKTIKDGAR